MGSRKTEDSKETTSGSRIIKLKRTHSSGGEDKEKSAREAKFAEKPSTKDREKLSSSHHSSSSHHHKSSSSKSSKRHSSHRKSSSSHPSPPSSPEDGGKSGKIDHHRSSKSFASEYRSSVTNVVSSSGSSHFSSFSVPSTSSHGHAGWHVNPVHAGSFAYPQPKKVVDHDPLLSAMQKVNDERTRLQLENGELTRANRAQTGELEMLRMEVMNLRNQTGAMEGQLRNMRNQNECSRRSFNQFEAENKRLKRENGEMKEILKTLEAAVRDMQPKLVEMEKVCEEQKLKIELQERQLNGFEEQKKLLSDRNVVLIEKCEKLQAEMNTIAASKEQDIKNLNDAEMRFQAQKKEMESVGKTLVLAQQDLEFAKMKQKGTEKALEDANNEKKCYLRETMKAKSEFRFVSQRADRMCRDYKTRIARYEQLFQTVNSRVSSLLSEEDALEFQEQLQAEYQSLEILKPDLEEEPVPEEGGQQKAE